MSATKQFILSLVLCLAAFSFLGYLVNGYLEESLFSNNTGNTVEAKDYDDMSDKELLSVEGESVSALIIGKDIVTNRVDALVMVKAVPEAKKIIACSIPPETKYNITGKDIYGTSYSYALSFRDAISHLTGIAPSTDAAVALTPEASAAYIPPVQKIDSENAQYLRDKIYALTNMNIDYFAVIDTDDVKDIVNTLCPAGFEYTVPYAMEYSDEIATDAYDDIKLNGIAYKQFGGSMASQLVRYRGKGDNERCDIQLDFLGEFIGAAFSPESDLKEKLLDENFRNNLLYGITTNVTAADILDNLDLMFTLGEYDFIAVPYRYGSIIDTDNIPQLRNDLTRPITEDN